MARRIHRLRVRKRHLIAVIDKKCINNEKNLKGTFVRNRAVAGGGMYLQPWNQVRNDIRITRTVITDNEAVLNKEELFPLLRPLPDVDLSRIRGALFSCLTNLAKSLSLTFRFRSFQGYPSSNFCLWSWRRWWSLHKFESTSPSCFVRNCFSKDPYRSEQSS